MCCTSARRELVSTLGPTDTLVIGTSSPGSVAHPTPARVPSKWLSHDMARPGGDLSTTQMSSRLSHIQCRSSADCFDLDRTCCGRGGIVEALRTLRDRPA